MTYVEFLQALGNTSPICFKNYSERITVEDIPKYIDNCNLCFIPNIGGTKKTEINEFKAFFIDMDCGRDKDNHYFNADIVNEFKAKKLKELKDFHITPNAIVETRNGLHSYWFIKDSITMEQWYEIENALIKYFGADTKVCIPSHQMRLPGSKWLKDRKNPFYCKVLFFSDFYTYIETYCSFAELVKNKSSTKIRSGNRSENKCYKTQYKPSLHQNKPPIKFKSYKEVFDYLTKEVSMFDYLVEFYGLEGTNPNSFHCIFHDDKNPSANIFKTDNGTEIYHCRTENCNFTGNLIQVVAHLEDVSRSTAIDILCSHFNIAYTENTEMIKFLLDNLRSINDDIELSHRDLYGVIYRYLPTLKELHYTALRNIIYANCESEFIFSASVGYIADALGRKDKKSTCADINLLCLLNLIKKIDLEENTVSDEYKRYIKKTQLRNSPHINVYSLPAYTYKTLTECNEMAKMVKAKNLRKKNFTYESVANAFGIEVANKVFPQIKNTSVKAIDKYLLRTIEYLLENNGYFTQNTVYLHYVNSGVFFNESVYIKQLPAIMQLLNLEKVKASKKLKEQYNITSAGYPSLYIKR